MSSVNENILKGRWVSALRAKIVWKPARGNRKAITTGSKSRESRERREREHTGPPRHRKLHAADNFTRRSRYIGVITIITSPVFFAVIFRRTLWEHCYFSFFFLRACRRSVLMGMITSPVDDPRELSSVHLENILRFLFLWQTRCFVLLGGNAIKSSRKTNSKWSFERISSILTILHFPIVREFGETRTVNSCPFEI